MKGTEHNLSQVESPINHRGHGAGEPAEKLKFQLLSLRVLVGVDEGGCMRVVEPGHIPDFRRKK